MKTKLRNITITLEEEVAHWARIEAARKDTSVSGYLAGVLKKQMNEEGEYELAKKRALKRKPFLRSDGKYLSREEAHERSRSSLIRMFFLYAVDESGPKKARKCAIVARVALGDPSRPAKFSGVARILFQCAPQVAEGQGGCTPGNQGFIEMAASFNKRRTFAVGLAVAGPFRLLVLGLTDCCGLPKRVSADSC